MKWIEDKLAADVPINISIHSTTSSASAMYFLDQAGIIQETATGSRKYVARIVLKYITGGLTSQRAVVRHMETQLWQEVEKSRQELGDRKQGELYDHLKKLSPKKVPLLASLTLILSLAR